MVPSLDTWPGQDVLLMRARMKATDQEVTDALARLHDLAEQTREQLRMVLRMTDGRKMTMSYSKLFAADESLGRLAHVDRKLDKETSRDH